MSSPSTIPDLPFVGRTRELQDLGHVIDGGDVSLVLVQGEEGSGKSSLLRNFFQTYQGGNDSNSLPVIGQGVFASKNSWSTQHIDPLTAVWDAIDGLLLELLQLDICVEEALENLSMNDKQLLETCLPRLRQFCREESRRNTKSQVQAPQRQGTFGRLITATLALFRLLSETENGEQKGLRILLIWQDLQNAAPAALQFLQRLLFLCDKLPQRRFNIIATCDVTLHPQLEQWLSSLNKAVYPIAMSPLSVEDVAEILRQNRFDANGSHRRLAKSLHKATQGHALSLTCLWRLVMHLKLDKEISENEIVPDGGGTDDENDDDDDDDDGKGSNNADDDTDKKDANVGKVDSDADRIEECYMANLDSLMSSLQTDNSGVASVRTLFKVQWRAIPEMVQSTLLYASCYGAPIFSADTLFCLLYSSNVGGTDDSQSLLQEHDDMFHQLLDHLHFSCSIGILEELHAGFFRFQHSIVQQAVYNSIDASKRQELHQRIGQYLQQLHFCIPGLPNELSSEHLLLRQAVSQLNHSVDVSMQTEAERLQLAKLNHCAARVAMEESSFFSEASHLQKAMQLLSNNDTVDPWEKDHDWMVALSIALTQAEYCCGHWENSMQFGRALLTRARSFREKKVVYHTQLSCLLEQKQNEDARELVLSILYELGERFPKRRLEEKIKKQVAATRKWLKSFDEQAWLYRNSGNEALSAHWTDQMEFIERLVDITALYNSQYRTLALLRGFQLSLQYGRFALTPLCFSFWSSLLIKKRKFNDALRFGTFGVKLAKENFHQCYNAHAVLVYYSKAFWLQRNQRLQEPSDSCIIQPLVTASQFLCHEDSCQRAAESILACFWVRFCLASSIDPLARDMMQLVRRLEDDQQDSLLELVEPWLRFVTSFISSSKSSTKSFTPKAETGQHYGITINENGSERQSDWTISMGLSKMIIAFYSDDMETVQGLFHKVTSANENATTSPPVLFTQGMIALSLAGRHLHGTNFNNQYQQQGRAFLEHLEEQIEQSGAVQCQHMALILRAEDMALSSPISAVMDAYKKAIAAARSSGSLFHRALGYERAGHFFWSRREMYTAKQYLKRAIELYGRWGAVAKVERLEKKYRNILYNEDAEK